MGWIGLGWKSLCWEGAKKNIKKLTNISLYVCMSAEKSKMLVFFYVFSPNSSLKDNFQNRGFMLDIHTYEIQGKGAKKMLRIMKNICFYPWVIFYHFAHFSNFPIVA